MSARPSPRKRRSLALVGAALALGAALLASSDGEARPGGGGSFSGGGSRSGSSSSSSGFRSGSSSSSSGSSYRPSYSSTSSSTSSSSSSSGHSTSSSSSSSSSSGYTSAPAIPFTIHASAPGRSRTSGVTKLANGVSPFPAATTPRPAQWPEPHESNPGTALAFVVAFFAIFAFVIALIVWAIARSMKKQKGTGWSTQTVRATGRSDLDAIRQTDPDFSIALFEDFLYFLYTETHTARGNGTLERLAPWLKPPVRAMLAQRGRVPVTAIVIGAMRFLRFETRDPARYSVQVELETNYTEGDRAFWATERWWLSRSRTAKSRPPQRARVFDCANCGAPLDKIVGNQCRHCGRVVDTGELDWTVDAIEVVGIQPRGPMLTGTTEEVGTNLPTIVDPALQQRLSELRAADPQFDMRALEARVGLVFATMQTAWSSLEWERARPFLSDNLYEAQRYWIEAYRKSGLRNVTEQTQILRIDTARVTHDKWFTAITLRVYARGLDYTIRAADGAVVGGDRRNMRLYSEYWTMLRGTGVRGKTHTDPVCPKCGAPLAVTMAGNCKACQAKVNSGTFDWVLARIEQDEAYTG